MEVLQELKIELIDYNNIEHLSFLKKLMESKDINYLWDLTDKELSNNQNLGKYIIMNNYTRGGFYDDKGSGAWCYRICRN